MDTFKPLLLLDLDPDEQATRELDDQEEQSKQICSTGLGG